MNRMKMQKFVLFVKENFKIKMLRIKILVELGTIFIN